MGALILGSLISRADVSKGSILTCQNQEAAFEIHQTAAYKFEGSYSNAQNKLLCTYHKKTSNMTTIWTCAEVGGRDGSVVITVDSGGITGGSIANVYRKQVFPLKKLAYLGSISCR